MLDAERKFFKEHGEDLLRQYPGKFVVIKETNLLGAFDSIQDALGAGAKEYGFTSFLVRRTNQAPEVASLPALALGLLRANPSHPTGRARKNP